jgi:tetratricopeptide (TPR) repeat protein
MFEAAEGCLRQLMSRPGRLGTVEYTTDTWGVALATPFESNQPIFDRVLELAAQSHTLDQQTADLFRKFGEHYQDGLDRRPAAACFRLAFQAQAKVLPLESGAVGRAADDVACAYTDLGFPHVAHEFLEKAFGLLGGFSQRADLVQTVLLSHPVNALNAFSERLPVLVETLGPAHVLVAATRYSIGIISMGLRDFERAAAEMEQSVAIRTGVNDAVLKAEAYYALGDAYEKLDRSADQIRAIRELISLLKVRRPTCALLVNAYFKLADLVTALGNPDEGEEARQAGIAVIASAPQLFAKLLDAMGAASEDEGEN